MTPSLTARDNGRQLPDFSDPASDTAREEALREREGEKTPEEMAYNVLEDIVVVAHDFGLFNELAKMAEMPVSDIRMCAYQALDTFKRLIERQEATDDTGGQQSDGN